MYSQTHGRTDGLTDELIWGGADNLRFLQVNIAFYILHYLEVARRHGKQKQAGRRTDSDLAIFPRQLGQPFKRVLLGTYYIRYGSASAGGQ